MSENLLNLVNIIRDRKNKDEEKSYTSSLLSGGLSKCIDKLEEEFGELKEALNEKSNIVHEAADTIYKKNLLAIMRYTFIFNHRITKNFMWIHLI